MKEQLAKEREQRQNEQFAKLFDVILGLKSEIDGFREEQIAINHKLKSI